MRHKRDYWLWFWGFDQKDLKSHSIKKRFNDFDKMKTYSAKHSAEHQWIAQYWSDYELVTPKLPK